MDHKVSKDMISSGMIPSGEKTQADLSRTQYGSAPSPSKLMDAYKSMYGNKEEVINEHHKKDADGNTIPHEGEEVKEENINELKSRTMLDYIDKASDSASKELGKAEKTTSRKKEVKARLKMDKRERGIEMAKDKIMKRVKEEYDLVYEHFIGEGFSEEETLEKMSNLTEEQLDEFMKALATSAAKYGASLGGNTPAPKMGPARPDAKPGQIGFKASSPSEVISDVNARKKQDVKDKLAMRRGEKARVVQDEYQGIDTYDIVLDHFLNEGYEKEDIIKVMSTVNLTEEPITATIATIGAGLLKGAAVAGKAAMAAGKAGLAATKGIASAGAKGLAAGSKAAMKGVVSAAKPVTKSATAVKDLAGKGVSSAKDIASKGVSSAKDMASNVGQQVKKVTSQPTGGSGEDRLKRIKDFAKREIGQEAKRKIMQGGGQPSGTNKTGFASAQKSDIAASADLFDIVKGQLLDEGLSEEEIRDIMLTLTPDEILNEMGMATPESGTGKYYDQKNPTPKQKEIQKNLPQNRKPTPEQQAARDKYAKIKDMTNKGDHQGASKLYNS